MPGLVSFGFSAGLLITGLDAGFSAGFIAGFSFGFPLGLSSFAVLVVVSAVPSVVSWAQMLVGFCVMGSFLVSSSTSRLVAVSVDVSSCLILAARAASFSGLEVLTT